MRKVSVANSLGRSLPLQTSVVMAAQQPSIAEVVGEMRDMNLTRNQRRLKRKANRK